MASDTIRDPKQLERVVADLLACELGARGGYAALVLPFGRADGGYDGAFTGPLEGHPSATWRVSVKCVGARSHRVAALKKNLSDEMMRHRCEPVLVVTNAYLNRNEQAQLVAWLLENFDAPSVVYDGSKLDGLLRRYPWVRPEPAGWLSAADGLQDLGWPEGAWGRGHPLERRSQAAFEAVRGALARARCVLLVGSWGAGHEIVLAEAAVSSLTGGWPAAAQWARLTQFPDALPLADPVVVLVRPRPEPERAIRTFASWDRSHRLIVAVTPNQVASVREAWSVRNEPIEAVSVPRFDGPGLQDWLALDKNLEASANTLANRFPGRPLAARAVALGLGVDLARSSGLPHHRELSVVLLLIPGVTMASVGAWATASTRADLDRLVGAGVLAQDAGPSGDADRWVVVDDPWLVASLVKAGATGTEREVADEVDRRTRFDGDPRHAPDAGRRGDALARVAGWLDQPAALCAWAEEVARVPEGSWEAAIAGLDLLAGHTSVALEAKGFDLVRATNDLVGLTLRALGATPRPWRTDAVTMAVTALRSWRPDPDLPLEHAWRLCDAFDDGDALKALLRPDRDDVGPRIAAVAARVEASQALSAAAATAVVDAVVPWLSVFAGEESVGLVQRWTLVIDDSSGWPEFTTRASCRDEALRGLAALVHHPDEVVRRAGWAGLAQVSARGDLRPWAERALALAAAAREPDGWEERAAWEDVLVATGEAGFAAHAALVAGSLCDPLYRVWRLLTVPGGIADPPAAARASGAGWYEHLARDATSHEAALLGVLVAEPPTPDDLASCLSRVAAAGRTGGTEAFLVRWMTEDLATFTPILNPPRWGTLPTGAQALLAWAAPPDVHADHDELVVDGATMGLRHRIRLLLADPARVPDLEAAVLAPAAARRGDRRVDRARLLRLVAHPGPRTRRAVVALLFEATLASTTPQEQSDTNAVIDRYLTTHQDAGAVEQLVVGLPYGLVRHRLDTDGLALVARAVGAASARWHPEEAAWLVELLKVDEAAWHSAIEARVAVRRAESALSRTFSPELGQRALPWLASLVDHPGWAGPVRAFLRRNEARAHEALAGPHAEQVVQAMRPVIGDDRYWKALEAALAHQSFSAAVVNRVATAAWSHRALDPKVLRPIEDAFRARSQGASERPLANALSKIADEIQHMLRNNP